jgi:hypothetical protein
MKNIIIFLMAASLWAGTIGPGYALLRRDFSAVEGPVIAKKEKESQIVIKSASGDPIVFNADASQFGTANVGDTVLIMHQINNPNISTLVVTQPKP